MGQKIKLVVDASNFFCRQSCFICGSGERHGGLDIRLKLPDSEKTEFICGGCLGLWEEDFDDDDYSKVPEQVTEGVTYWPVKLKMQASRLKAQAAELEKIAEMEISLPSSTEWDKAINMRIAWDKEIGDIVVKAPEGF